MDLFLAAQCFSLIQFFLFMVFLDQPMFLDSLDQIMFLDSLYQTNTLQIFI